MAGGYLTARPLRELRPKGLFASLTLRGFGVASFLTPHFSPGHGTPCHYTRPPHSSLLRPHHPYGLTPHPSFLTPHSSPLTPHSSLLTPHPSFLTPHSSLLTPHSSLLTPHSSLLTPHSSLLTPHSSPHPRHSGLDPEPFLRQPTYPRRGTACRARALPERNRGTRELWVAHRARHAVPLPCSLETV